MPCLDSELNWFGGRLRWHGLTFESMVRAVQRCSLRCLLRTESSHVCDLPVLLGQKRDTGTSQALTRSVAWQVEQLGHRGAGNVSFTAPEEGVYASLEPCLPSLTQQRGCNAYSSTLDGSEAVTVLAGSP